MALIPGAINFGSNFNIGAKGPIDARQRVETIADLTTVWTADIPAYKGMVVSVLEDNSIYILKTDDATVLKNWKKIGDVSGDITSLQTQITANKTAIDTINGDGDGSFAKGDADTLAAAKADATAKADAVKGSDADAAGAATVFGANKAAAAAQKSINDFKGRTEGFATKAQGDRADTALQSIEKSGDYINVTEKAGNKQTVSLTTQTINGASATAKGLAEASDVKGYVDGKITDVTTAAGALGTRVTALEDKVGDDSKGLVKGLADVKTAINTINGDGDGSITKAVTDAKTELIGTEGTAGVTIYGAKKDAADAKAAADAKISAVTSKAGDKYVKATTAGTAVTIESIGIDGAIGDAKTELIGTDKDAATANTIKGAKAAAKAADDKAAAAQTAADSKIKSVTGNTTVIAATDANHNVTVSLKTSDKGNVKFTQDKDGLSASVTIPAATVTGVAANDKFLSLTDKLVGADISIAYDADDKKIYLYGKDKTKANAVSSIDCKDFITDGMLDGSALYKATAETGTVRINGKDYSLTGLTAGHSYIVLVWNTDAAKDAMAIDVTSLIDVYTAGDGLTLTDHKFAVDYTKVAKKGDLDNEVTRAKAAEAALLGKAGESGDTIISAKADAQAAKEAAAAASAKVDTAIADLDVANNISAAVAGITVTVNETNGRVDTPIVAVTPGAVAAGDTSVVTGGAVKTYVDTAITNAALIWNDITA